MSFPIPTPAPIPTRFPLVLTPEITVTAVYPNDGPKGSVTFDDSHNKARGALFLTSQNGNNSEGVPIEDILSAINSIL